MGDLASGAFPDETRAATDEAVAPAVWPRWQCFACRLLLLYYVLYAFPGPLGQLLELITRGFGAVGLDAKAMPWSWPGAVASVLSMEDAWQALTTCMDAHQCAPYEVIHQSTGSGDTGHAYARLLAVPLAP